mmetsp:Transcript_24317/g.30334  ORF Transcript_24317/g.30334 Transcript_24317/m.30334 type:complete len:320 (-) Transcript_24317:414-1373(-)
MNLFNQVESEVRSLYDVIEDVKKKTKKRRMNDSDAEKLFDIQETIREFVFIMKEKFCFLKLDAGEKNNAEVLKEIKSINNRLAALETSKNINISPVNNANVSSPRGSPLPNWVQPTPLALASSNIPVPKFSGLSSPSCKIYGNQLFQNSIIFENVLMESDDVEKENLKWFFFNLINERLNGVLPSLEESSITKVSVVTSKAHSFLVSFDSSFDAKNILESSFYFSNYTLEENERVFVYPLLSPSEKRFQREVLKKFQQFQSKNASIMKYNFRIYMSGYDLKLKADDRVVFFNLSGDGKENDISPEKIKKFLTEKLAVSL